MTRLICIMLVIFNNYIIVLNSESFTFCNCRLNFINVPDTSGNFLGLVSFRNTFSDVFYS